MPIKNIMEDVVISSVEQVLDQEKNLPKSREYKNDIVAYVLNRIPAKYTTSNRGILHEIINTKTEFQEKSDVLFLIHEAIEIIKKRRGSSPQPTDQKDKKSYYFPHIMGEVMEATTFTTVPDVTVKLLCNDELIQMIDTSWTNPFVTSIGTKGYYHFWPFFNEDKMQFNKGVQFVIEFTHSQLNTKKLEFSIKPTDNINLNKSLILPITLLDLKPGATADFIYRPQD